MIILEIVLLGNGGGANWFEFAHYTVVLIFFVCSTGS